MHRDKPVMSFDCIPYYLSQILVLQALKNCGHIRVSVRTVHTKALERAQKTFIKNFEIPFIIKVLGR